MKSVHIYTDGACKGNPGPGGWGFVVVDQHHDVEIAHQFGAEADTTNNRMELMAAIEGARLVMQLQAGQEDPDYSNIFTDSTYVSQGISTWIHGWIKRGWRTASNDPVKNADLWQELLLLTSETKIRWIWVKGHAGNRWNERADELACQGKAQACG